MILMSAMGLQDQIKDVGMNLSSEESATLFNYMQPPLTTVEYIGNGVFSFNSKDMFTLQELAEKCIANIQEEAIGFDPQSADFKLLSRRLQEAEGVKIKVEKALSNLSVYKESHALGEIKRLICEIISEQEIAILRRVLEARAKEILSGDKDNG